MPKLGKQKAASVADQETSSFEALPEGVYICSLKQVEVREGQKAPYWSWEFEVIQPDEHENRKLWVNTSLADNAEWKLKEVFEAFGVPTTTDTDELIGQVAKLIVTQRTIERGARAGEIGNNVDRVLPYSGDDDDWDGETPI